MKRTNALILGFGVALLACGGDDSSNGGGSGGATLISSTPAPADATCPNGGVKIQVGVDKNGNGVLDPDEVTGTQEVCTGSAPATLTTVTPNGPDATCKNGGITVKSGPDTNGNGKLDPSEVTQTQEICDGGSSTVLSTTTTLAAGNVNCPLGGVETQSGADDGAGGAVAGDGVLAPSEVTSTTYACASDPGYFPGSFAPPPAVAGATAAKIDLHGGAGSTANGGNGGTLNIAKQGTLGGHIKVFATGKADASFTMPTYTPTFGATKLDVTADTTLMVHTASSQAADGEYYFMSNELYFRMNATNQEIPVTGLHVAAGKTFTLPDTITNIGPLTNDIFVEGTLAAANASGGNSEGINVITTGAFVGAATGKIISKGAPVTNAAGGNGSTIEIEASLILNQAALDSSGASGGATGVDNGGTGGVVELLAVASSSSGGVYNSGTITTTGGDGSGGGNGGAAGQVEIFNQGRPIDNSGAITADGGKGSGTTGNGGSAVGVQFIAERGGGLRNSGAIHAVGGAASAACTGSCSGGSAGGFVFVSEGGPLVFSGDITANAGNAVGTAGGNESGVEFISVPSSSVAGDPLPAGGITVSGNFSLFGGDGTAGGQGGSVTLNLQASNIVAGEEIALLGYGEIDTYGGDGATSGGTGGAVAMTNNPTTGTLTATGGVINYATIVGHGGKASTSGSGGNADGVTFTSGATGIAPDKAQVIYNAADIDVSGGAGISSGGTAGTIAFQSVERIDSLGALNSSGGNSSGANASSGTGGNVRLASGGAINIAGAISSNGGSATGATAAGATGLAITVEGDSITNSKAISANGGNSNGVAGANGGSVQLTSQSTTTVNTGTLTATGGTGSTNGTKGTVSVDGIPQ